MKPTTTNNNRREVKSQDDINPPPAGASSHQASTTRDAAEPDDDDDTMGDEAEAATFPQKLMEALDRETSRDDAIFAASGQRVFEWLPAGEAFVIRDRARFEQEVLTKYFTKCKFMSFTRKLYRWGFRQVTKDSQLLKVFQHMNFVRGEKQRCLQLRSIVKFQPPSRQPRENIVTGYDTVRQDRPLALFGSTVGHRQRMATGRCCQRRTIRSPHKQLLLAFEARVLTFQVPPFFFGLQESPSFSLPEGRPRLVELEKSREQLRDMLNDSSQPATASRLQQSRGDGLPGARSVLGLKKNFSSSLHMPNSAPGLQSGREGLLSPHGALGLGGRPSPSLRAPIDRLLQGSMRAASAEITEGRLRLQETEHNRQQLMDMRNNSRPQAPAPRLQSGGANLLTPSDVLGLGERSSPSLRVPIEGLQQGTTAAVSTKIAEGRIRLPDMDQRRRQLTHALNHRSALRAEQSPQAPAPRLQHGGTNLRTPSGVLGLGGRPPPSLRVPIDELSPGTTTAVSTKIAEGRSLLRDMEQRRRRLTDALDHRSALRAEQGLRQLLDTLENGSASRATAPSFGHLPPPPPPPQPPTARAPHHSYGTSPRERDTSHAVVELAAEILKRGGPNMEPRRALKLARQLRVSHR